MGRIRTIKPEFTESESLSRCSREARLCFILLWTIVDDSGRTHASSRILASRLFPYDDDALRLVPEWLSELEREGCIRRYAAGENSYLDIPKWEIHQKIDRPSASKLPAYENRDNNSTKPRAVSSPAREDSSEDLDLGLGPGPGPGTLMSETERSASDRKPSKLNQYTEDFEDFWKAYPTDSGQSKLEASKQWRKLSGDDRAKALAAIPGFKAWVSKQSSDYRTVHACRFLSQRRFDGFTGQAANGPASTSLDWRTFTDGDYQNVAFIAKRTGKWLPAYGPVDRIPQNLVDEVLREILAASRL